VARTSGDITVNESPRTHRTLGTVTADNRPGSVVGRDTAGNRRCAPLGGRIAIVPPPRVRFAPSPTGYLHIGGARTALFNWFFARRHGGAFVLRIEDTDAERSSNEMVDRVLEGLRWLGLDWDEGPLVGGPHGPYFQSQRFDQHRTMAARLLAEGHAYYCYCTPEELKAKRAAAEAAGGGWRYDRTCAALPPTEIDARERAGMPRAVRVRVPSGSIRFHDLVRGPIEFDAAHIEDFVIVRSDGHPTYHLSVVSDDVEMAITHVVRGEDHISNTPKQILLYQAISAPVPQFAHVPLILGPDRKRLSKRHGATAVGEYERQGYLPEAMVNFLALLGWSPPNASRSDSPGEGSPPPNASSSEKERAGPVALGSVSRREERGELHSRDELIEAFALEDINGGNAVFNVEKLDWFNQQYITRLSSEELARRLKPFFESEGLWNDEYLGKRFDWLAAVLEQLKPRSWRLTDFIAVGRFFFTDAVDYDQRAVAKQLQGEAVAGHLRAFDAALAQLSAFDQTSIEGTLRAVAEARGVKASVLIHPVRVAITGKTEGPGLFETIALVGRERTHARLAAALGMITAPRI